jgi:hypothetical protein
MLSLMTFLMQRMLVQIIPAVALKPENKYLSQSILVARTCSSIQLCFTCACQFHCTYHFWLKCLFHEDKGDRNFQSWRISLSIMPDAKVFVPVSTSKMLGIRVDNILMVTPNVPLVKLAKPHNHQPWWPPLSHGRHGAPLPAPPHATINQNSARQDCVVKTKKYYYYYS